MAIRKRTSISDSSSNSYEQEIESRLKSLEEKSHTPCGGGGDTSNLEERVASLETKLNTLIGILKKDPKLNIAKLSNHTL